MTEIVSLREPLTLPRPLWRLAASLRDARFGVIFDGSAAGARSHLTLDPALILSAKRILGAGGLARVTIEGRDGAVERREARPFEVLRELLADRIAPRSDDPSFQSGAVGYLGYEAGHFLEELPDRGEDDLALPDLCVGLVDAVIGHDHASGESWVSATGRGATKREARQHAEREAERLTSRVLGTEAIEPSIISAREVTGRFDEASYAALVARVQEHIRAGAAFEVCLTHRLEAPFDGDPFALYAALRQSNPAPHAAWLRTPGGDVISSSPERFLRVGPDRVAETRPIKGTRPRGATPAEDRAERLALQTSAKDRAENLMIVDLARSDLGRVAKLGTVTVPELLIVEAHPTVHQLVSTVRAELRDDVGPIEAIEACFPPGSMTGAPKIEAMKLIDELEPLDRGPYSGALGWIDDRGHLDLSVVIRTVVIARGIATIGTGGAVTLDSDPIAEHQETRLKARALVAALGGRPQ